MAIFAEDSEEVSAVEIDFPPALPSKLSDLLSLRVPIGRIARWPDCIDAHIKHVTKAARLNSLPDVFG